MLDFLALAAATPDVRCDQTRYLPNGRVIESRFPYGDNEGDTKSASAEALAHGSGSAYSSVSARSTSTGHSSASSSSSSSEAGGKRRTVTVTREAGGCRIVIDERLQGDDQ